MHTEKAGAYAQRFKEVLDYIDRHLDEALSVEKLSHAAHLSKFHFHRQFSEYCGISVSRYIQLMRLKGRRTAWYSTRGNRSSTSRWMQVLKTRNRSHVPSSMLSARRQAPSAVRRPGLNGAHGTSFPLEKGWTTWR